MGKELARVPKIRFPGFTGEWVKRKLGDVAKFSKGSGYSKEDLNDYGTPIILYGRMYTKYQTQIDDIDTFADEQPGSVYSTGKEVITPASGETAEDISIASAVIKPGILLGGDINIIYPCEELTPVFLVLQISTDDTKKELYKRAQGKSIVHLHNADLQEAKISYPLVAEQQKISAFFQQLDNLIALQQRKLAHWRTKKQGLLQKMFPKPGTAFPELRFPGFTEPWVEQKLTDEVKLYSGLTYSPNDVVESHGTLVLRSSNVKNGEIIDADNVYVKLDAVNSANVLKGDIIIVVRNGSRTLIGKHAQIKEKMNNTVIGAFMTGIRAVNSSFINALLSTTTFETEIRKNLGATINQITNGMFQQMLFFFPTESEQQKIGGFFQRLDTLITAQQRQLEHLQQQKKALLQQMFV